jgi:hypothetical protein
MCFFLENKKMSIILSLSQLLQTCMNYVTYYFKTCHSLFKSISFTYCVNLIVFTLFGKSCHVHNYDINDLKILQYRRISTHIRYNPTIQANTVIRKNVLSSKTMSLNIRRPYKVIVGFQFLFLN